jgi:RNA polymerase sigma factor (sigma-70 family)
MSATGGGNSHPDDPQAKEEANRPDKPDRLGERGDISPQDLAAIAEEFSRPSSRMRAILVRKIGSVEQARDVVQDVFCDFLETPRVANDSRRSYFLGACLHRVQDIFRQRQRRAHPRPMPDAHDEPDRNSDSDPPYRAEREDTKEHLRRAVEGLSSPLDKEVTLLHLEGLEGKEITERLGTPNGTAKRRWHTARLRLRDKLAGLDPNNDRPPPPVT